MIVLVTNSLNSITTWNHSTDTHGLCQSLPGLRRGHAKDLAYSGS